MLKSPGRSPVGVAIVVAVFCNACGATQGQRLGEPAAASVTATPIGKLVAVGLKPEGIAVDPVTGLVAVAVRSPDGIVVLDRSGSVLRRITLPSSARHLRFAEAARTLLVPAERSHLLIEMDVSTGQVLSHTMVGRQPHDAVSVGDRIFVTDEFSDAVSVIEDRRVLSTISAPGQPGGIAESHGLVAVVGVRSHNLRLIDAVSLATVATLPAGQGPTHVVGGADGRFNVVDTIGNALPTFAPDPPRLVSRVPVPGTPYGMAIDLAHGRLLVTLTALNEVVDYDVRSGQPVERARFPTPRQPNSIAVDATTGSVCVTGTADGVVQIVGGPRVMHRSAVADRLRM